MKYNLASVFEANPLLAVCRKTDVPGEMPSQMVLQCERFRAEVASELVFRMSLLVVVEGGGVCVLLRAEVAPVDELSRMLPRVLTESLDAGKSLLAVLAGMADLQVHHGLVSFQGGAVPVVLAAPRAEVRQGFRAEEAQVPPVHFDVLRHAARVAEASVARRAGEGFDGLVVLEIVVQELDLRPETLPAVVADVTRSPPHVESLPFIVELKFHVANLRALNRRQGISETVRIVVVGSSDRSLRSNVVHDIFATLE